MVLDLLAINTAKLSAKLVRVCRLGAGSALPGRVALFLSPKILENFKKQLTDPEFDFFITGTNGKTTSTGILESIIEAKLNQPVISNSLGANLYYGIVSAFVSAADASGKLSSTSYALEVDEASMPALAKVLKPSSILVTNIYRDQLDRFGELDASLKLITKGIKAAKQESLNTAVIYNLDDSNLRKLPEELGEDYDFYSFQVLSEQKIKNLDAKTSADETQADFYATIIKQDLDSSLIELGDSKRRIEITLNLPGLYNVYNATAAAAAAYYEGLSLEQIKSGIESYKTNFGRAETKSYQGKTIQSFLIKNPTGCSEVLKHIAKDPNASLVIALNDNYADGRDVSWIWDSEFEHLAAQDNKIFCTGHRAKDLALRLKYAGVAKERIFCDEEVMSSINKACTQSPEKVYVLPTYTALLDIRNAF